MTAKSAKAAGGFKPPAAFAASMELREPLIKCAYGALRIFHTRILSNPLEINKSFLRSCAAFRRKISRKSLLPVEAAVPLYPLLPRAPAPGVVKYVAGKHFLSKVQQAPMAAIRSS